MTEEPKNLTPKFATGEKLFSWEAYEYFPFKRGKVWITVFYGFLLGFIIWGFFTKDWWLIAPLLIASIISFVFLHKETPVRPIDIYEKYLHVGRRFYAWTDFDGYWFVYDERQAVAVINFQFKDKIDKKLSLQMAALKPDDFRAVLSQIGLVELEDKKESLMDLWSRVLKL